MEQSQLNWIAKPAVVEYGPDGNLRDSEQVPLLEEGGTEAFLRRARRRCLVHIPGQRQDGLRGQLHRYFYKPQPLRTLEEMPIH